MADPTLPRGNPLVVTIGRMMKRLRVVERQNVARAAMIASLAARKHMVFTYAGVGAFTSTVVSQPLTITWPGPFADTDYTVVCDVIPPSGSAALLTCHVSAKTTTGCMVTIYAGGASVPSGAVLTVDGNHL
jgi:hypothetical protein